MASSLSLSFIDRSVDSIATALKGMDAEGYDLREVRKALDEIEKARKEREEGKELREAALQAKQSARKDRRFIIAFRNGRVHTTSGIEYSDESVHVNSTFSTPGCMDDNHDDMATLKSTLDRADIAYHIEYLD